MKSCGKLGLTVLVMALAWSTFALAEPVSEDGVTRAVETWLRDGLTEGRPTARVVRLDPYPAEDRIAAYIATLAGGGYCIGGADDVLLPVYFFAPQGEFDPGNPDLAGLLESIAARLAWVEEGRATRDGRLEPFRDDLSDRARVWQELAAGVVVRREPARDVPELVILPLTSTWHQGPPFNQDCPVYPDGGQTIVGCVATAMAQVMYYWQWPETGASSHTAQNIYTHTDTWIATPLATDPGITGDFWADHLSWTTMDGGHLQIYGSWDNSMRHAALNTFGGSPGFTEAFELIYNQLTPGSSDHYANFAATSYHFDQMEDYPVDPASPAAQAAAVLGYHAGIAVNMNWGRSESVSGPQEITPALTTYFRFDPDCAMVEVDPDLMVQEILWSRPVLMVGFTATGGGHVWVASGVDTATPTAPSFWMNMGWGPDAIGWAPLDQVPGGFDVDQLLVTRVAPADVVRFLGNPFLDPGADGSPSHPYNDMSDALVGMPTGGTLIIGGGHDVIWSGGGVMSRPMVVRGIGSTISAGP